MDLGAFLRPGDEWPITVELEEEGRTPPTPGRLTARRGRPVWFCAAPQPTGRTLTIALELPGFELAADGGLEAAGPRDRAGLYLLSRVRGCRYYPPRALYVLRLELLGRIWPEPLKRKTL